MNIDNIPMVRLTWQDAQDSGGAWTGIEDILAHETATCQEVGWLIHQDDNKVIVMRSRIVEDDGELNEGGAHIAIPASWVVKIEVLHIDEEDNDSAFNSYKSVHAS